MAETMNRRTFLQLSGMTLAVSAANPLYASIRSRGGTPPVLETQLGGVKTLVMVFLRGGCDGLNLCVPIDPGEYATYQTYRAAGSGIQLTPADLASTQLDSNFALHPAFQSLFDGLYRGNQLAVLPNVHYDNGSRSHFDSQAFYDSATPWDKNTTAGWLSRHMQLTPGNPDVLRAISFGTAVPAAFRGVPTALTFSNLASLSVSGSGTRDTQFLDTQEQVYALPLPGRTYDAETLKAGQDLVAAIRAIRAASLPATRVGPPSYPASAPYNSESTRMAGRFKELAQLIKSGAFNIELAEIDMNGFDTHTGQGAASGAQSDLFLGLADTLTAFYYDLDTLSSNVLTLVITEFGRTARANGNGGTDHGSAMCTLAAGGSVVPGVHFGAQGWISLSDLRDSRDLKHSADFRDVYTEILLKHLGNAQAGAVFPGWTHTPIGFLA